MCIYCGTTKYRKIYENHNGTIPKDETGRTYDIHHLDGNRQNNSPYNLTALSIQEHYDIHYRQGDYSSCWLLGKKMGISQPQQSELMTKASLERVANGTHPFQRRLDGTSLAGDMVKEGKHPLQRRADGSSSSMDRMKNGTNPFCRRADGTTIASDMVKARTHPFLRGAGFKGKNHSQYKAELLTFIHNDGRIEKDITKYNMGKKYSLNQGNLSSVISGRPGFRSVGGWKLM
jgi:hypothetical protein